MAEEPVILVISARGRSAHFYSRKALNDVFGIGQVVKDRLWKWAVDFPERICTEKVWQEIPGLGPKKINAIIQFLEGCRPGYTGFH